MIVERQVGAGKMGSSISAPSAPHWLWRMVAGTSAHRRARARAAAPGDPSDPDRHQPVSGSLLPGLALLPLRQLAVLGLLAGPAGGRKLQLHRPRALRSHHVAPPSIGEPPPAPAGLSGDIFIDRRMAFVQTSQWFYNVPPGDPFGSQAPLFYGPIQQGKDGWNAAFFCGSNAVLRREALMELGLVHYVHELNLKVNRVLVAADSILRQAEKQLSRSARGTAFAAVREMRAAASRARRDTVAGRRIQPGDRGLPFCPGNPTTCAETCGVEALPEGGFGLRAATAAVDRLQHRRTRGMSVWLISKNLPPSAGGPAA